MRVQGRPLVQHGLDGEDAGGAPCGPTSGDAVSRDLRHMRGALSQGLRLTARRQRERCPVVFTNIEPAL